MISGTPMIMSGQNQPYVFKMDSFNVLDRGTRTITNSGTFGTDGNAKLYTGMGCKFNGSNQHIETEYVPNINSLTLMQTIRFDSPYTTYDASGSRGGGGRFYFGINAGNLTVGLGSVYRITSFNVLGAGVLRLVLTYRSDGNVYVWANGVLIDTYACGAITSDLPAFHIGRYNYSGTHYGVNGLLNNIIAIEKEITDEDVAYDFNNPEELVAMVVGDNNPNFSFTNDDIKMCYSLTEGSTEITNNLVTNTQSSIVNFTETVWSDSITRDKGLQKSLLEHDVNNKLIGKVENGILNASSGYIVFVNNSHLYIEKCLDDVRGISSKLKAKWCDGTVSYTYPNLESTSFISTWRTTTDNESITLPLRLGYYYDMTVDWGDDTISLVEAHDDINATHIYEVSGVYTITISGVCGAFYFNNVHPDKDKILGISNLGAMYWATLYGAFYGCTNLNNLETKICDTSNVIDMGYAFRELPGVNLNISTLDTAKVELFTYTFYNCLSPTIDVSGFDTSKVTSFLGMFYNTVAEDLDVSGFDTSSAITLSSVFTNSKALVLDISGFDLSKVTTMNGLFQNTVAEINTSGLNTSNVTNFSSMFNGAKSSVIDVSSFDVSNTTSLSSMFQSMPNVLVLDVSGFDTALVTNMATMFYNLPCAVLDVSGFNTANVTTMSNTFYGVQASILDVSGFNTAKVTTMNSMFKFSKANIIDIITITVINVFFR